MTNKRTLYAFHVVYIQDNNGPHDHIEGTKLQCFVLAKDMWEAVDEACDRVPNVQQIRVVHPEKEGIPNYCVNEKEGDVCSSEAWIVEKSIEEEETEVRT